MQLKRLLLAASLTFAAVGANAEVVFFDDFETGDLSKWPIVINPPAGAGEGVTTTLPKNGSYSMYFPGSAANSTDRWAAPLSRAISASETAVISFWHYDATLSGNSRIYIELRSYTNDTYSTATGALQQLYALGEFNNTTYPGETHVTNKYNARIAFGSPAGWFPLNLAGSPNRSVGWHEMRMEINSVSAKFYVDGVLSKEMPSNQIGTIDHVVLGSGSSSIGNPAYFDDVKVEAITSAISPSSYTVTMGEEFNGGLSALTASDDVKVEVFNDPTNLMAQIEYNATTTATGVTSLTFNAETSAARPGLALAIALYNHTTTNWTTVAGRTEPQSDTLSTVNLTTTAADYVGAGGELAARTTWSPINDEDPSQDGWLHFVDLVNWNVQ